MLKAPGTKRLKLKCDSPLSNFAFNFNLRRYILSAEQLRAHLGGWLGDAEAGGVLRTSTHDSSTLIPPTNPVQSARLYEHSPSR